MSQIAMRRLALLHAHTLIPLLIPIVIEHHMSHQLPWRSAASEELELRKSLLRQVIEAVHQDPAALGFGPHLQHEGRHHRVVR